MMKRATLDVVCVAARRTRSGGILASFRGHDDGMPYVGEFTVSIADEGLSFDVDREYVVTIQPSKRKRRIAPRKTRLSQADFDLPPLPEPLPCPIMLPGKRKRKVRHG